MSDWPAPEPPAWALEAGCPAPLAGEDFCSYVERLGLSPERFLVELQPRTVEFVNIRLASALAAEAPRTFRAYCHRRYASIPHG